MLRKSLLVFAFCLVILPVVTSAKTLTVVNATKQPFTVLVKQSCAKEFGVIAPNAEGAANEEQLIKLCGNTDLCRAEIYKSNNCTGKQLAYFTFSPISGLGNLFGTVKNYSITLVHPFNQVILTEAMK